jgi:fluoride exporter
MVRVDAVAAVAVGGVVGALARHVITQPGAGGFPWATFGINVAGCFAIGVLMVLAAGAHRLVRPFLGTGVLGGFTTFSAYAVEARALLASDAVPVALAYLAGTLVAALVAVQAGAVVARLATGRGEEL